MRCIHWILHRIFSKLVFYIENTEAIFLTIDDSPSESTIEILDLLDKYKVKATFFCVGKNIDKYSTQLNEIKKRGHALGYHSFSHDNAWKTQKNSTELISDFEKNKSQFNSKIYRPPYGMLTWSLFKYISLSHKIIFWDVLTEDWKSDIDPIEKIKSKLKSLKKGTIIVFHDNQKSRENCKIMLTYFLDYVKERKIEVSNIIK
jgi:peptidoglycan-N-acetylglucosamine deacetylase